VNIEPLRSCRSLWAAWRIPKPDPAYAAVAAAATAAGRHRRHRRALGLAPQTLAVVATAEPDLRQPLQQRHPLLFRADRPAHPAGRRLVLRRHRQFNRSGIRRARALGSGE